MGIEWIQENLLSLVPIIVDWEEDIRELSDKAFQTIAQALMETSITIKDLVKQGT